MDVSEPSRLYCIQARSKTSREPFQLPVKFWRIGSHCSWPISHDSDRSEDGCNEVMNVCVEKSMWGEKNGGDARRDDRSSSRADVTGWSFLFEPVWRQDH